MGFLFKDTLDLFVGILDIFAVAILVYYLYKMAKGTNVPNIVIGIIIAWLLWQLTEKIGMTMFSKILGAVLGAGAIALIVVFQPEIRQFLQTIGMKQRNARGGIHFWRRVFGTGGGEAKIDVAPIVRATIDMSAGKVGALIVIQQGTDLGFIAETGIMVDAQTSAALLENIFFKNAPLHDGAVVIDGDRVVAAKCVLPSTLAHVPNNYGMRHLAAL
jgi:DNA integrity scanning protein DisA with diadenylate cyclase activity